MHFGVPEFMIISAMVLIWVAGRAFQGRSPARPLTFERTSDILIGLGIITMFLVTFLFLSYK